MYHCVYMSHFFYSFTCQWTLGLLFLFSHWVVSGSCDPNCCPPGSSVHGISQARILEWVAITFSRGHLGDFHHLAVGNTAAMKNGEQIIIESLFSILFSIYPEVKLLDHVVILFLIFQELPYHFFIAATPFYTPNNNAQVFQFLHILINTCDFVVLMVIILMNVR